ncbi:sigma-54-dependent Fis family transcriptional regulator [candidate division KSB1 bacterium 4484_87]|nr:MAG: sigma-54-dependent Fis family transcriptional regulator [candidate division KSB1 bacterium 4484_87]
MTAEQELTHDILDSIAEGLFTVDKDFKINYFNRAAEEITGMKRAEVLGKFCKHIFKSNLCFIQCPIAQVLESGTNIYDLDSKIRDQAGRLIPVKMNVAILRNSDGEPIGGVISFRDVSDLAILQEKHTRKFQFHGIVGHSKSMHEIFELIEEISDSDASVLIQGESGTGKEMIANAIQATSQRKDRPFVKVNCSVFSPQLLASELFGHVKGAFTGAIRDRKGRFELADGGTIFLDEVGEMPLQMQLQLLRVLQEGTFERVGESKTHTVDVRVIAATNKNLVESIKKGEFREDLFYRLNVIPVSVPPLRDRPEDVPYLVKHFLKKFSLIYGKKINDIEDPALELLVEYTWPGNIRELENALEYAFVRTRDSSTIALNKLPLSVRGGVSSVRAQYASCLESDECSLILKLLEKHKWNKTRVAQELGISRSTLWRKMKHLNLPQ